MTYFLTRLARANQFVKNGLWASGSAAFCSATLALCSASFFLVPTWASATETLTVFTYDSFAADWGPAPKIEKNFEAVCDCDLKFVSVDVSGNLISRLKLEGANTEADVVLGLDTALMPQAAATGLIAEHGVDLTKITALPGGWTNTQFVPFDWGHFAFVYNSEALAADKVPTSLRELADSDLKIVIQDPRTSTPGLGLLLWVKSEFKDDAADIWAALSDNIVTVTKGWSEAYGLFLEGEADMVLSYTTSPAYHAIAESDDRFKAAEFAGGHYAQVEVAAALSSSDTPELTAKFMAFIADEGFQSAIPTGNWMYPVTDVTLPDGFSELVQPSTLLFTAEQVAKNRDDWIAEWLEATSR